MGVYQNWTIETYLPSLRLMHGILPLVPAYSSSANSQRIEKGIKERIFYCTNEM